jgi:hypothetical protein
MHNDLAQGQARKLSEDELRHITGGNVALATGLSAIFAGFNAVLKAVEGLIVTASHNNPKVVAGINTFNQITTGAENVAIGVAQII